MSSLPPTKVHEKAKELTFRWVGKPIKRKEDLRFVTGNGRFVDDIKFDNALYVSFARSRIAHARIRYVDVSKALRVPGVKLAITGKEVF